MRDGVGQKYAGGVIIFANCFREISDRVLIGEIKVEWFFFMDR